MAETKRFKINLGTFDLLKGTAMICVIAGHALNYYPMEKMHLLMPILAVMRFLGNGLMPMFFIVTGFGFKVKPASVMLKKTAAELIKPYLIVMCSITVLFPCVHYLTYRWWPGAFQETIRYTLGFLIGSAKPGKLLFGYSLYECTVVWFLLSLFTTLNLLNLILQLKKQPVQILLVALCALAGYFLYKIEFTYYCIPQGLVATSFCYTGFLAKKYKVLEKASDISRYWFLYLVLVAVTVLQMLFGRFDLAYGEFKFFFLDLIAADCSGILFLLLGVYASRFNSKGLSTIKKIGIYSYWLMCIHNIEQTCIPWYKWSEIMAHAPYLGFLIEVSVKTLIYVTVCSVLKKIMQRKYLRERAQHAK